MSRRDESGQYADRIPVAAAREVFERRTDFARPLTAGDVATELDCSRRTAHTKLNALVERGALSSRKVDARSKVFWIPVGRARFTDRRESTTDALSLAVERADLPGSGPTLDRRREALSAAHDYLRDHPKAATADFLRGVYPDYRAGFRSEEVWWNAIQPALKRLPGVDPPKQRGHIWHYSGD